MGKDTAKKIKLSNIQKIIGKRMGQSKRTQPCFYIGATADITDINTFRRQTSKQLKARLSTNDLFFKALGLATCDYPLMAGRIRGENIEISESVNVGFAISVADDKLLVPVIKGVEKMTIKEISEQSSALTQKAKSGEITPDQMSGATIALSSLGMFGVSEFIAVLPLDMPSILAVGKPTDTVVSDDGKIEVRKLISLSLACDGRIVSPDYAAKFLNKITAYLQQPSSLL